MPRTICMATLVMILGAAPYAAAATRLHSSEHAATFEAGLASLYGYNEAQAERFFAQGAEEGCVMCHWGMAYAVARLAETYVDTTFLDRGHAALLQAEALAADHGCTPLQGGLILATRAYYQRVFTGQHAKAITDHVDTLRCLHRQFNSDPDIATLFAIGLLVASNASCHNPQTGFFEEDAEVLCVLEHALRQHPDHIGLHHLYIHAREVSNHPERALPSAYALPRLAPTLGHLVHMPSHIFARLGMYDDAVHANRDAIALDLELLQEDADHTLYRSLFTLHNYHFLWSMLSLRGEYENALNVAREVQSQVKAFALAPGLWRDILLSFEMLAHIEAEHWHEASQTRVPDDAGYYLEAISHLGHGLAAIHRGGRSARETAKSALRSHRRQSTGTTPFAKNIHVAAELLDAESLRADGRWLDAFAAYQTAVTVEDSMGYQEPWPWQLPARNYLANALTTYGAYEEAVRVCDEELAKHPRAPRTVRLLAEALQALGDPRMHTLPGR